MNSLPLSPVVISYATLQRKPLLTSPAEHCRAKLVPRPFRAVYFLLFWVGLHINIDKGGNSLPKHSERTPEKFARISECFRKSRTS